MSVRMSRRRRRRARHSAWPLALALSALAVVPGGTLAEETPYCRKVRARAGEDTALLVWPSIVIDGLRFPSTSTTDLGPTFGDSYQARLGLSYSPTDLLKAMHIGRAADIDCELQATSEALHQRVLEAGNDASLPALRAQVAFLDAHREQWRQLLSRAQEQQAAGLVTAVEMQDLRRSAAALERKLEALRGEKDRLEVRTPPPPVPASVSSPSLGRLADAVAARSLDLDRESSRTATYDAFRVKLSGGAMPDFTRRSVSWFGMVEVSYNLGGIARGRAVDRYLAARAEELRQASYELPSQAAERRRDLQAKLGQARRELQVVERDIASIRSLRTALERSESSSVEHVRATLMVEEIWVDSDRAYLAAFVEALLRLTEEPEARG